MSGVLDLFTAFGLSASAGLKAYATLLMVGLLARFTSLITLSPPYDLLSNEWVLAVLAVLAIIELVVDKIPGADSLNDLINTLFRPAAGALLFASTNGVVSDVHPVLAMIAGLLVAGSMHAAKATARPVVTGLTFGLGNPIVSLAEDLLVVFLVLLAVLMSALGLVLVVAIPVAAGWLVWRRRSRARRIPPLKPALATID
jgi:hypothetical protein